MKQHISRRAIIAGAAGALAAATARMSFAADTLKFLVGFPAGGAVDSAARIYAEASRGLGTTIVDNRPGASGNIAGSLLAQSRPNGDTIMLAPVNVYCISKALYRNPGFDPQQHFAPVGIVSSFPWGLAIHPSVPVKTVPEFVAWAKANPEKAQCGMVTVGGEGHLMAYAFAREAGITLNFVPYKGGAPMAQDLMAGHIPMVFDALPNLEQPHRAGKFKVLALTSEQPATQLPDVPTFHASGYAGATGESWIGAAARKGSPPERLREIADALAVAGKLPEVRAKLTAAGLMTRTGSAEDMAAMMERDTKRYSALVAALNLKLD